jgi:hypothetical protein
MHTVDKDKTVKEIWTTPSYPDLQWPKEKTNEIKYAQNIQNIIQ